MTAGSAAPAVEALCVYTDGASRGNPGPASAGWVLYGRDGAVVETNGRYLGRHTNNEAEYMAACLGLEAALARGARHVLLRADSELLVRQLTGQYQVRQPHLQALHRRAQALLGQFVQSACEHVPRARNAAADAAANRALDAALAAGRARG